MVHDTVVFTDLDDCLLQTRRKCPEGATLTMLTTCLPDPGGYGRVIRGKEGTVCRVVEDQDASPEEKQVSEINVGTYVVEAGFLEKALGQLHPQNAQGEYYLTDIIEMAVQERQKVVAWVTEDSLETTGVNTRVHLALVEKEMRRRICERLMLDGVTILDRGAIIIDIADNTITLKDVLTHDYLPEEEAFALNQMGRASAYAVLMMAVMLAFMILYMRQTRAEAATRGGLCSSTIRHGLWTEARPTLTMPPIPSSSISSGPSRRQPRP